MTLAVTTAMMMTIHAIDGPSASLCKERSLLLEPRIVLVHHSHTDLPLQHIMCGVAAQIEIDDLPPYLILCRCGIHHLGILDAGGRNGSQQLSELLGCHGRDLAIDDDGHGPSSKLQTIALLGHTRQFLERIVGIVHTLVTHQSRQVKHQFATLGLDHGTLTHNHDLGQRAQEAIDAQRVGLCARCHPDQQERDEVQLFHCCKGRCSRSACKAIALI